MFLSPEETPSPSSTSTLHTMAPHHCGLKCFLLGGNLPSFSPSTNTCFGLGLEPLVQSVKRILDCGFSSGEPNPWRGYKEGNSKTVVITWPWEPDVRMGNSKVAGMKSPFLRKGCGEKCGPLSDTSFAFWALRFAPLTRMRHLGQKDVGFGFSHQQANFRGLRGALSPP